MTFDYDIIVVGLGPAGSTFAQLAADKLKVFALSRPVGESGLNARLCTIRCCAAR